MSHITKIDLVSYDYHLPKERIALSPASPRDSARLFVYDTATDTVVFDRFLNLTEHLPPQALLVVNETRVVPARLLMKKTSGGAVRVLFLLNEHISGSKIVRALADRAVSEGDTLFFPDGGAVRVARRDGSVLTISLPFSRTRLMDILLRHGTTPIPPYLKHTSVSEHELRKKYQAIFAHRGASVAAPTASLHFTPRLLSRLAAQGIGRALLTLDVGLGTFAPITDAMVRTRKLHAEHFSVPLSTERAVAQAKKHGRPVVAVGTTVLRTLESAAGRGGIRAGAQNTNLFIQPPYRFLAADALITNFHVPQSSLMLAVDAFLEWKGARRRILELYRIALREKFRFLSFGDGMLIK